MVLIMKIRCLNKLNNIINVDQFNRNNLRLLFKNANIIKNNIKKNGCLDILKGKVIGLYFDEPSTRTYGSFSVSSSKTRRKCIIIK